jgi:hypothetical protein
MTISSQSIRQDYTGSGITGPYTFPFTVFDITTLGVIVTDSSGNDTILVLNIDFTATGTKAPSDFTKGGSITLTNNLTSGYHLSILSNETGLQGTSIKNNSSYYAFLHENEFDKLALFDLQVLEKLNKTILAPDSEPAGTTNLTLPSISNRSNNLLGFDSTGNLSLYRSNLMPVSNNQLNHCIYLSSSFSSYPADNLFLFSSIDGYTWKPISNQPLFTHGGGVSALRDPSVRYWNGMYYCAYTTQGGGYSGTPEWGLLSSPDLINWTDLGNVDVSTTMGATFYLWAPELFVDPVSGNLCVTWSGNTTSDVNMTPYMQIAVSSTITNTSWSTPIAITKGGSFPTNVIDTFLVYGGGTYYLWFKNETTKYIGVATSNTLMGTYTFQADSSASNFNWGSTFESISVVQVSGNFQTGVGTWRAYFGFYTTGFYWSEASNVSTSLWLANWTAKTKIIDIYWGSLGDQLQNMCQMDVVKISNVGSAIDILSAFMTTGQPLNNYMGNGAPRVTNDNTQGWGIGSIWVDVVNKAKYICVSAATGAASWI